MKILLTKSVKALGKAGEIVEISDGHARNYILPRKLGVPAGSGATQMAGQVRKHAEAHEAALRTRARELTARLASVSCVLTSPSDEAGRLYGSITEKDIVAALAKAGVEIDRRQVQIDTHIKSTGDHKVRIRIAEEEFAEITVRVEPVTPC